MYLNNIRNKYPELRHILLSCIIFVFIAKAYAYSVFCVNLGVDIPHTLNISLIWGYRICLILLFLFIKWTMSDIILFTIGFIFSYMCKNTTLLAFVVMGIYCKSNKISNEYLIKNYFYITSIFLLSVIVLNTFNIIPNSSEVHFRNNIARNDLGLGNPNAPFLSSIPLYAGYIYLRFDKYDIWDRILLVIVSLLIYSQTYSRTGLLTILTILLFVEIIKRVNIKNNKLITFILSFLPVLIAGFSFFTALFLDINFFNRLLSERPKLWNIYTKHIELLPNEDYFSLIEMYPLDNGYIFSFILYGAIFTILILALYTYYMRKNVLNGNGKMLAVCSMFLIYSFGENLLFNAALNFTLILAIASLSYENFFILKSK